MWSFAGAVGVDPGPYTLQKLFWMWEGRVDSIAFGIGKAFGDGDARAQPKDRSDPDYDENLPASRQGMRPPPGKSWVHPEKLMQHLREQKKDNGRNRN